MGTNLWSRVEREQAYRIVTLLTLSILGRGVNLDDCVDWPRDIACTGWRNSVLCFILHATKSGKDPRHQNLRRKCSKGICRAVATNGTTSEEPDAVTSLRSMYGVACQYVVCWAGMRSTPCTCTSGHGHSAHLAGAPPHSHRYRPGE
jgi:hypothetical protein